MQTLRDYLDLIDQDVSIILLHKLLDKERFLDVTGSEEIYNCLKNAKSGLITISYLDGRNKHSGFTAALGEGIACRLSNEYTWYSTSNIKSIDWKNKTFETLNNIYKFEFQEVPIDEAMELADEYYNKFIKQYGSQNQKTKS